MECLSREAAAAGKETAGSGISPAVGRGFGVKDQRRPRVGDKQGAEGEWKQTLGHTQLAAGGKSKPGVHRLRER